MYEKQCGGRIGGSGGSNDPVMRAEAPMSETAYAAQALELSLCHVEARLIDLAQKLQPVLEDRPQKDSSDCKTTERQMFSPIGRGIMETSYRLELVGQRINVLLDSLAI